MCGRFTLTTDVEKLKEKFQVTTAPESVPPRYNVAPTQPVAVVLNKGDERVLEQFHWGLIPVWAKDRAIGNRMINARAETLAEKSSFKRPLQRQRCLVLADGFYEWQKGPDGKTPMYIQLEDRAPFAFAGLWDLWRAPDGGKVHSCTIITTEPNPLVARIHNRMPVILADEAVARWLEPVEQEPAQLLPLLTSYPAESMVAYPVSRLVNSPANDQPECIAPVAA